MRRAPTCYPHTTAIGKTVQLVLIAALLLALALAASGCGGGSTSEDTSPPSKSPDLDSIPLGDVLGKGLPTLAEFGSSSCIPCKTMKPILEGLAVDYEGKLGVVIVDVYDHMDLTREYGIMTKPTQIIFDAEGNQVGSHIGVWYKEDIVAELERLGLL